MAAIRNGQPLPNTVTHTYRGRPNGIQQQFDFYLPRMEAAGYFVGNQSTIPGHRGGFGLFLIILLAIPTLGLSLLFLAARPADTLVVTYQRWPQFMGMPEPPPGQVYRPQAIPVQSYPMQPGQFN